MCGRYVQAGSQLTLLDRYGASPQLRDAPLPANYNVAPTDEVYAVLARRPKGDALDGEPVRQLRNLRWGLVPPWSRDRAGAARLINARSETVHTKPAFRGAFARRRCLLPADGYYEWYTPQDADGAEPVTRPSGRPVKQPVLIRPSDGTSLAMAGLYEFWRDPAVPAGTPEAWLATCTVITTRAGDDVGRVHDRMPMTVEPDRWATWLDPELTDPEAVRGLLAPAVRGRLEVVPVGRDVNDVRNNGAGLIEPAPDAARPG